MATGSRARPAGDGQKAASFRERAQAEADRYGPDPWVFIRELLQNARDAGATQVRFQVADGPEGEEEIRCQDDGEGMSFEHARRFLFALYASSKEGRKDQAGKFGVGFWSVLRFEPSAIVIRSRPRQGESEPWGVALDGSLARVTAVPSATEAGTEVVLRRPRRGGDLAGLVHDAVWQSARHLSRRDDPEAPVIVEVNGRRANTPFALPAPSAAFRRGKVRGVVALGPAPRVELFSRGLRVRSTASLGDLLAAGGRHSGWMRVQFPELPGGLAPHALLESADLELMLSRSEARDTRVLARLVALAQRELERLIERQLAAVRPLSLWRRVVRWLEDTVRALRPVEALVVVLLVATVSLLARPGGRRSVPPGRTEITVAATQPFDDLGRRYRGPRVDALTVRGAAPVDLRYTPAEARPRFAALVMSRIAPDGSPVSEPVAIPGGPYLAASCDGDCLDVELPVASAGPIRLPVPTGHRLVSVSLGCGALRASAEGEPVVVVVAAGVLRYRTGPAVDPGPPPPTTTVVLPPRLARRVRVLRGLPLGRRVGALVALVRRRVAYDRSPETIRRHREAQERGEGFLARTLTIGAGDCDVQNSVLTALLQAAGVPARLAVGYLGEQGGVIPFLHAWAEYRDESGRWAIADASESGADPRAVAVAVAPVSRTLEEAPVRPARRRVAARPTRVARGPQPEPAVAVAPAAPVPSPWEWRALWLSPLLVVLVWWSSGARTRRALALDPRSDLSKLLQGVLQQPEAFGQIGALFHHPLVPLLERRRSRQALSLLHARRLAIRGRLFASRERTPLAVRARRAGAMVIDTAAAEGKTVADAFGAVDLDHWAGLIDRAAGEPLTDAVNLALRRLGEGWVVRTASDVPEEVAALDTAPLRLELPGTRLVLVDAAAPWLEEARRRFAARPRAAVFLVVDELARRLDLPDRRREPVLAECARAALVESFG